jgi:hypothetical protein
VASAGGHIVASVLDQAQNFSGGVISAARKRDQWARREANATDAETREQYREAIADLEARYPDLEDVPVGGAEAFARERGHGTGARSPVHEGRRRAAGRGAQARTGKPAASKRESPKAGQGKPREVPGLTPEARRSASEKRAAKGRPTPRVDRAIRETGIPSAISSSGSATMAALGATVGLALLYLLLSSAEAPGSGAAALPSMIGSVTRALSRFLSLEDVFPGPRAGAIAGVRPVKPIASPAQLDRVEQGSHGLPGEVGTAGIRSGDLSNPAAEIHPPRHRPRQRHHR